MDVRHLTLNELRTAIDTGDAEELSTAAGSPLVVISDDHETDEAIAALAPRLASVPCVLVADSRPRAPGARRRRVRRRRRARRHRRRRRAPTRWRPRPWSSCCAAPWPAPSTRAWWPSRSPTPCCRAVPSSPAGAPAASGASARSRPHAVLTDRADGTLTITLNRPHVHNAFSRSMRDGLAEALAVAMADDSVDRIVLRGAGPSFCSGGDLNEFGDFPDPASSHLIRLTRSPARLVSRLAPRVEVRTHGSCMGAGAELPAFAGRVVAHPGTRFALPELSLGLVPGAGGTVSLPRRIGRHRTALLGLTGTPIDAADRPRLGPGRRHRGVTRIRDEHHGTRTAAAAGGRSMYDFCVIGGGIVGLATAVSLQDAFPGCELVVVEKEADVGRHQTGHNSGVIHAGIYYAPGQPEGPPVPRGGGGHQGVLHRARHPVRDVRQAPRGHHPARARAHGRPPGARRRERHRVRAPRRRRAGGAGAEHHRPRRPVRAVDRHRRLPAGVRRPAPDWWSSGAARSSSDAKVDLIAETGSWVEVRSGERSWTAQPGGGVRRAPGRPHRPPGRHRHRLPDRALPGRVLPAAAVEVGRGARR